MSEDFKTEKELFAALIDDAVKTIKASIDDFSKVAAEGRDTAASAAKKAAADATGQLNDLSDGAQDYMGRGAAHMARSVATNPFAALAIAAGAGFLFGLATRGDRR
ncbi:hypothetical protein CCR94_15690 [Rhodoblastus sphagnicola]|uniref:DUF883 domain-containing protein n=1 Tax=Rhodoblastus sphagnicola TaxID=333368 RepID=A0A2S6N3Q4_9HYPH|nr:DUF883 family protein [Rhodoblastus sphagnicola]MBB4198949.1 ElaB/YqjD/DUF883 family membrane-anchored ribosome-binding protein [Rhodoblastus sphagnicola]PPQ29254.1 hypothetical protein CCR94_15690 [Rhodoblastus sphagnicola]